MFNRDRQTWQCSIITDCEGELTWFCQLAVPQCRVTFGKCRHKIKVLDIPLGGGGGGGGGGRVTND